MSTILENVRYSVQDSNLSITSNKTGVDTRKVSTVQTNEEVSREIVEDKRKLPAIINDSLKNDSQYQYQFLHP